MTKLVFRHEPKAGRTPCKVTATGDNGMIIVQRGSEAQINTHFKGKFGCLGFRNKLINTKVLVPSRTDQNKLVFAKSYPFGSISTSASVILNRNSRGHEWRLQDNTKYADFLKTQTDDIDLLYSRAHSLIGSMQNKPQGTNQPQKTIQQTVRYFRRPDVVAYILQFAKGKCELCGKPAPFRSQRGDYLEVHHVVPLAHGGSDTPENCVALCPNCHREIHHAHDKQDLGAKLTNRIATRNF
ncbi:HNH endonuclease [Cereibacter sphaeroides]|uniref:HNH endonuclease n=1 Tax=Cereibacter sphaeroides TaxID=1063 RepID=UPI001F462600|nr:HNH endonuclease [Cereibacter sphaeroides]MCE6957604.1 HNH endonuclease [Cereibacter sphaeroides]